MREQRYAAALQMVDTALQDRPRDLRLITARGLALGGLQRAAESLDAFETALQINPDFVPALRGAVQTGYAARDPRTPRFLKHLIELDANDATAHSMAGVLAFEGGDYARAAVHFEAGLAATEANLQAYAIYGACLLKLNRPAEAAVVFDRLSRADPRSTPTLRSLASAQAAAGNPELAAATLSRALNVKAEEQTYVDLAALCIVNNAPKRALSAIQTGLEKLPRSARLYALRGVVEAEQGLQAEAESDFGISNRLDPSEQYGAPGLGVLYTDSGRTGEASAILRSRVEKNPSDATLNYLLAQALVREGAVPGSPGFQEAEAALIRAVRAQPGYAAPHTALGKLYKLASDDARAIAEFQVAVELNGSDRTALNQLAGLLRRQGRIEEANALISRVRQLVIGATAVDGH